MKKSVYIYLVLVIASNFFNLKFMPLLRFGSDESLIALLGVILLGLLIYRLNNSLAFQPIVERYVRYMRYVWLTIGLSMLMCLIFWNQGIFQSLITYRQLFSYFLFPALVWIRPTEEDILEGFKYFTYTFLFIAVCVWILHIPLTRVEYDVDAEIAANNAIPGTTFIAFYFYHLLMKLRCQLNLKDLLLASALLVYFIFNQNRSLLFPCLCFYLLMLWKLRTHPALKVAIVVCICSILFSNFEMIHELIDETKGQLDDESYVRWNAIDYFLFGMSPNFLCTIFGNGMISANTNKDLWDMLYHNMLNFNDVGWFGYFAFFGIVGTAAIFNIILRIIFDKYSPSDLRMMLVHMCVPTIWALWMSNIICLFCLIVYVYIYRKSQIQADEDV